MLLNQLSIGKLQRIGTTFFIFEADTARARFVSRGDSWLLFEFSNEETNKKAVLEKSQAPL